MIPNGGRSPRVDNVSLVSQKTIPIHAGQTVPSVPNRFNEYRGTVKTDVYRRWAGNMILGWNRVEVGARECQIRN